MKNEMAQNEKIKKLETQYEKENRNLNEQLDNMQQNLDQKEYDY